MNKGIATLLILFSIIAPAGLGMDIFHYIDIPSLIIVFGLSIGVVIARHDIAGLKQLFNREHNITIIPSLCLGACLAAIIANLMALVVILTNLSDIKTLGPAVAVGVLSSLYCVLINLLGYCLNNQYTIKTSNGIMLIIPMLLSGLLYIAVFSLIDLPQ